MGGRVAQRGTHDQLLVERGLYARLWCEQSRAHDWQLRSDDGQKMTSKKGGNL